MTSTSQTGGLITGPETPMTFKQLGVIAADGSGSMEDPVINSTMTKAAATNIAIRDFYGRMQISRNANSFEFAHVFFDKVAKEVSHPLPVKELDLNAQYNPGTEGGTYIGSGLEAAFGICKDWFAADDGSVPTSATILVMSDGEDSDASLAANSLAIANQIKAFTHNGQNAITIATCYLASANGGTGAGPAQLQQICSDPERLYRQVYDPETMRKFYTDSLDQGLAMAGVANHNR